MAESTDRRLKGQIERVELIDAEIDNLRAERREVMAETKAMGYDMATFRQVLARRKLTPAERAAGDALIEAYEAALGGEAPAVPLRADAATLAAALLAEQIEGIADPAHAAALVEHVLALLDIRAEIAVLRGQEGDRKKLAEGEGFDRNQLGLTVRWYEKCAKHGTEQMQAGEQTFRLYRQAVDEAGGESGRLGRPEGAPTGDEKLAALFGKPAPKAPSKKQQALADAVAMARLNRRGQ